jgi:hypothetical protein
MSSKQRYFGRRYHYHFCPSLEASVVDIFPFSLSTYTTSMLFLLLPVCPLEETNDGKRIQFGEMIVNSYCVYTCNDLMDGRFLGRHDFKDRLRDLWYYTTYLLWSWSCFRWMFLLALPSSVLRVSGRAVFLSSWSALFVSMSMCVFSELGMKRRFLGGWSYQTGCEENKRWANS